MNIIFNYTDYRDYLKAVFDQKKTANPHFSHRNLASHLGLKAPGHMLFVMQGKRRLTQDVALRLIEYLKLGKRESDYFLTLLAFGHARTSVEKQAAFDELSRLRPRRVMVNGSERFYRKWYYSAIRASLDVEPFSDDYAALASSVCPPIKVSEAQEAIEVLLEERLIFKDDTGVFKPADALITTGDSWRAASIESLRHQFLDLGKESLSRFVPQERDASFLTVTLSKESFELVKEKVRRLRAEVLEMAKQEKKSDRVVQCNFTLFPLFKKKADL